MSKQTIKPNIQRRRLVQGAALSSAAIAVPGVASALCAGTEHAAELSKKNLSTTPLLDNPDVHIELVETQTTVRNGALARVTVTNKTGKSIKLSHISPGAVSTQKGVYQINATLSNNPLAIRSGGSYQFWLSPDDGTQAMRSRKPVGTDREAFKKGAVEVTVKTQLDSGPWQGTQRVQALIA